MTLSHVHACFVRNSAQSQVYLNDRRYSNHFIYHFFYLIHFFRISVFVLFFVTFMIKYQMNSFALKIQKKSKYTSVIATMNRIWFLYLKQIDEVDVICRCKVHQIMYSSPIV